MINFINDMSLAHLICLTVILFIIVAYLIKGFLIYAKYSDPEEHLHATWKGLLKSERSDSDD